MANLAKEDLRNRHVQVSRMKLLEILISNKSKHIEEYEEAVTGYKDQAREKLQSAYEEAKQTLEKNKKKNQDWLVSFDPRNAKSQSDYICLVDSIQVKMKVPRNYSEEYDAAIAMVQWDIRETLELTHAEFQCFVRNVWEWSNEFSETLSIYKK